MDVSTFIILFLIGFVGSFISGMLGIGGSIIKYPMLLYIPPLLGSVAYTAHEVAGISAIQVFFATLSGVIAYRGSGYLHWKLIFTMGISILIGSLLGGYGSLMLSETQINFVYAILATIAGIMMVIKKKEPADINMKNFTFNPILASSLSFITGLASGIVGAAGAFILVPIMLVVLKIPVRVTIATSLAVTFISSIGATIGKVVTDQVLYAPAIVMIIASIIAAPIGVKVGQRVNVKFLKALLAVIIILTAIKIWIDII